MKLYILLAIPEALSKFPDWDYDCYFGHVIEAQDEDQARQLAAEVAADEGKEGWLSPAITSCEELRVTGTAHIILSDFHAG